MLILLVERTMVHTAGLFERVLLDGGPSRNFSVGDVKTINNDKERLK